MCFALSMGDLLSFIANFFVTKNIGGAKKACGPFVIKWRHLILKNELKELACHWTMEL